MANIWFKNFCEDERDGRKVGENLFDVTITHICWCHKRIWREFLILCCSGTNLNHIGVICFLEEWKKLPKTPSVSEAFWEILTTFTISPTICHLFISSWKKNTQVLKVISIKLCEIFFGSIIYVFERHGERERKRVCAFMHEWGEGQKRGRENPRQDPH